MPEPSLTNFLLERIAEDETIARAASTEDALRPYGDPEIELVPIENWGDLAREYLGGQFGDQAARWHPLRVLAECEAKRAVIGWLDSIAQAHIGANGEFSRDADTALRLLAAVYADHPDYNETWRPE